MEYQFRTIIIPAATAPAARALAAALDPAGIGMWITGLSPTGAAPATHFISTGMLGTAFVDLLPLQDPETGETLSPGQPDYVAEAAAQAGVKRSKKQVKALFSAADVTTQEPHAAMARLDLKMVTEDTE
jgi:hypothetical protein